MAGAFVMALLLIHCTGESEPKENPQLWPFGSVEDIEDLSERDDVNVLFIVIDTLRPDRMSAYGYDRETTPFLKDLARFGVRFDRHLAQSSWTKPSMASMWTSFYPTRNGIIEFGDIIPEDAILPAEVFSKEGYRTVGIYRNGWISPNFGFAQGFEVYSRPGRVEVKRDVILANPTIKMKGVDTDTIDTAIEFLRAERSNKWFLYLHMMDVHEYTYDIESALFGSSYSDIYDNSIRWTDDNLSILFTQMFDWGLFKNTLIVITSDHGEAFMEHGAEGHAKALYRETTEIPMIMLFPFRLEAGMALVSTRTRNVDIWPTVYELLGFDQPDHPAEPDGVSVLADVVAAARRVPAAAESKARTGFAHLSQGWGKGGSGNRAYTLADQNFRYFRKVESNGDIAEELFDASEDPLEKEDVSERRPEILDDMRLKADTLAIEAPVWGVPEKRDLSEMELNQLRALGYKID
jgi:arylsulfatase A-like enzyme